MYPFFACLNFFIISRHSSCLSFDILKLKNSISRYSYGTNFVSSSKYTL